MRYIVLKDLKKRKHFTKTEILVRIIKSLLRNNIIKIELRNLFYIKLLSFSSYSSKTAIVNRCIFTGRKYILNRSYRLSRLQLPELAKISCLKGIIRYGW